MLNAPVRTGELAATQYRFWQDRYATLLFVCFLCLSGLTIPGLSGLLMSLRWGFLAAALVAGLYQLQRAGAVHFTYEHYCLLGLIIVSLLSCTYSLDPWYSIQRLASYIMLWIAVFLGAWSWLQSRKNVLIGVDVIYSLVCLLTVFTAFNLAQSDIINRTERADGGIGTATGAGGFAVGALPLVVWHFRYSHGRARQFDAGLALVLSYLLLFSGARAAILMWTAGFIVVAWHQFARFRLAMLLAGGAIIGVCAGGLLGLDMLPDFIVRKESISDFTGRGQRWELGLHLFRKQPILGHGYGLSRYLVFMDPETAELYAQAEPNPKIAAWARRAAERGDRVPYNLHNDHIERLVETGIIGHSFFAAFFLLLLHRTWQALRSPVSLLGDLARWLCIPVWYKFANSFSHSGMFAVGNGPCLSSWYALALFMAAVTAARREGASAPTSPLQPEIENDRRKRNIGDHCALERKRLFGCTLPESQRLWDWPQRRERTLISVDDIDHSKRMS